MGNAWMQSLFCAFLVRVEGSYRGCCTQKTDNRKVNETKQFFQQTMNKPSIVSRPASFKNLHAAFSPFF